jgi:hypothetical protein
MPNELVKTPEVNALAIGNAASLSVLIERAGGGRRALLGRNSFMPSITIRTRNGRTCGRCGGS